MSLRRASLSLLAFTTALLPVTASAASPLEGLWLTQNQRSIIALAECDQGLCGNVFWIIKDGMQTDSANPDESKRSRPMCGLPILWGFEKDGDHAWENGTIYKADEGDLYDADLALQEDGTLKVRGYMGISLLGKTQVWTRVSAKDYPSCKK